MVTFNSYFNLPKGKTIQIGPSTRALFGSETKPTSLPKKKSVKVFFCAATASHLAGKALKCAVWGWVNLLCPVLVIQYMSEMSDILKSLMVYCSNCPVKLPVYRYTLFSDFHTHTQTSCDHVAWK